MSAPWRPHGSIPPSSRRELTLRGGNVVWIRPIHPDDAPRLQDLHRRLSRETTYQRFFTVMKRLPTDWARMLANVDYQRRLVLVAEAREADVLRVIGVARYEPTDEADTVEVAFVVQDSWQNRGLGKILFADLLRAAADDRTGGSAPTCWRQPPNTGSHHALHSGRVAPHRPGRTELVFTFRDERPAKT